MSSEQKPGPGSWRGVVPVAMLAAGLLFGTAAAVAQHDGAAERPTDLVGLVRDRSAAVEGLTAEVDALAAQVESLSEALEPVNARRLQADDLAPVVGSEPVEGPALRVVLDDAGYSLDTLPDGYTVDDVVVHQQDVQAVVNALWAGGAEAMMVQDQRIVATSSVQCVGNTLYLQGRVYSPPYMITAVGDVDGMQQALLGDPVVTNYRSWADILGLGYVVEEVGEVELPGFSGTVRPQHAQLVEPEPAEDEDPVAPGEIEVSG